MSPRLIRCCLLLLLPWAAEATTPVAQYPVQGKVSPANQRAASDLILAGVKMSQARDGFEPATPYLLPASCAPPTGACLAGLGKGQHVLYADAKEKDGGRVAVTLWLVAPSGARSRPVRFEFDPFLQDVRSGYQAIELLERLAFGAEGAPPETASTGTATSEPEPAPGTTEAPAEPVVAAAPVVLTPESTPTPTPDAAPSAVPAGAPGLTVRAAEPEPAHPSAWMSTAGNICTYGGLGVLAGGAVFGLLSRSINDDLSARYQSGDLRGTDSVKYQQVRTFNLLANTLMVGGAVVSAAGLSFWALAPSATPTQGGAYFSVSGRF